MKRGAVHCKRGLALPAFYDVIRKGALQTKGVRLPAWTETQAEGGGKRVGEPSSAQ